MGKMERNLGEGWENSVIHLFSKYILRGGENLALEMRGVFIKNFLMEIIQDFFFLIWKTFYVSTLRFTLSFQGLQYITW